MVLIEIRIFITSNLGCHHICFLICRMTQQYLYLGDISRTVGGLSWLVHIHPLLPVIKRNNVRNTCTHFHPPACLFLGWSMMQLRMITWKLSACSPSMVLTPLWLHSQVWKGLTAILWKCFWQVGHFRKQEWQSLRSVLYPNSNDSWFTFYKIEIKKL